MRSLLTSLAAAALLLGACSYDFSNPAEKLDAGEVAGRVVADTGGGVAGLAGVRVRLRNASESVAVEQLTRDNGRFVLLSMKPGRHTVLFDKKNAVGATTWSITRDVDLAFGSDGQPEGVIIGDIQIRYPVTITGTFTVPSGTFYPTSVYGWDDDTGTPATFPISLDLSGTVPASTFTYSFDGLSVGPHRLRFAALGQECPIYPSGCAPASYVLGPVVKDVAVGQEGQTVPMGPLSIPAQATGTGRLRFKVVTPPSFASPYLYAVTLSQAPAGAPVTCPGAAPLCTLASDGTVEADLAAGAWTAAVSIAPPDFTFYKPPNVVGIVNESQTTDLGALYITDWAVAIAATAACVYDSDCGGGTCSAGTCSNATPNCIVGTFPECSNWQAACFMTGGTTTPCSGGAGVCALGPFGDVCMPNGARGCRLAAEPFPVQPPICSP